MITKEDLEEIINDLAKKQNKIFSKEAQFQFDLAWELRKKYDNDSYDIVLEYLWEKKKWYIDIVVFSNTEKKCIPIELKYKTTGKNIKYIIDGQSYRTYNQGACDNGSYDYIKDIYRMESIVKRLEYKGKEYEIENGFAIILTNDKRYYEGPDDNDTPFKRYYWKNFILAQPEISGERFWVNPETEIEEIDNQGKHTTKDRKQSIKLQGTYRLKENWRDYTLPIENNLPQFKYLITEIPRQE